MTEQTTKVWKQASNEVIVTGVLAQNNLEIRERDEYKDGAKTGNKYNAIMGDLVVRVKENENHTIRLSQNEFTKAGAPNKLYAGLVTIMNETVSIADLENNPEATPTRLRVVGELSLNEYAGHDLEIRSFPTIRGRFVNRLDATDESENKAEFDLDGMVAKTDLEHDTEGEATGRAKLSLFVPTYNSVIPLNFTVGEEGAEYVTENFEIGSTVRIYGDMVNFRKVTPRVVQMGFGADKIEEDVTFVNENLVKGGTIYDEGAPQEIDADLVKQKLDDRERYLETLIQRAKDRPAQGQGQQGAARPKTGGFGGGANPAPVKTALDGAGEDVDLTGVF